MTFDAHGNLFLSTGDNTNPHATGYAPIDQRPGRGPWDAQKSSANTNDLRGKILRIHPEPNGTYTIPEGNLFAKGTPKTRPEIYTMGHRNPYRISVDKHTGFLYWATSARAAGPTPAQRGRPARRGEPGASSGLLRLAILRRRQQGVLRLRLRHEHAGQAVRPGASGERLAEQHGAHRAAAGAEGVHLVSAAKTDVFPLVGRADARRWQGRCSQCGLQDAARNFPSYYNGKLLAYEWMRGWIMAVTMNAQGDLVSMERFMPSQVQQPDRARVLADRRSVHARVRDGLVPGQSDARLVRIEYNGGNRSPSRRRRGGQGGGPDAARGELSSQGTNDPDADAIRYQWTITGPKGVAVHADRAQSDVHLRAAGRVHRVACGHRCEGRQVDGERRSSRQQPPQVDIGVAGGNRASSSGDADQVRDARPDREDSSSRTVASLRIASS
jgi:cytochrome c